MQFSPETTQKIRKFIYKDGELRRGTIDLHPGLSRRVIIFIILFNFFLFMMPDASWHGSLPDIGLMPSFIQRNATITAFPNSVFLFYLVAPVSAFIVTILWVTSAWRAEIEDMENLKTLNYRTLMVFLCFLFMFLVFFRVDISDSFIFKVFGAGKYKLPWFAVFGSGMFIGVPTFITAIVFNLYSLFKGGNKP
jgi:hypothetical protein